MTDRETGAFRLLARTYNDENDRKIMVEISYRSPQPEQPPSSALHHASGADTNTLDDIESGEVLGNIVDISIYPDSEYLTVAK